MGILTFKGGVHPYDGKELSKNSPVVKYLPKGDMVYPLSQHIGAPAAPIVQKGDHVLAGQKIADAAGFVSSPIHASVSGMVKGIEPRLTATGSTKRRKIPPAGVSTFAISFSCTTVDRYPLWQWYRSKPTRLRYRSTAATASCALCSPTSSVSLV